MKIIQRHCIIVADKSLNRPVVLNLFDFKAPSFLRRYSKHHLSLLFDDNGTQFKHAVQPPISFGIGS